MNHTLRQPTTFAFYFDRVYIINLSSRPDRLRSVLRELERLGFADVRDRIFVRNPPMPQDANNFPSKGVYSNFLSHLGILRDAREHRLCRILVLEDDAIFLRSVRNSLAQSRIVADLERYNWGMWFAGHRLRQELSGQPRGVLPTTLPFSWAHCYVVHARSLDALIAYLEATLERPPGHPAGGRMYIDGAFSMFRALHPEHLCLISNPAVSIQKGSASNLGERKRYALMPLSPLIQLAWSVRDEFWRWTGIDFRKSHFKKFRR